MVGAFFAVMHHSQLTASVFADPVVFPVGDITWHRPDEELALLANCIQPPADAHERRRFAAIARHLAQRDGASVAALLEQPSAGNGGIYVRLPTYAAILLTVETCANKGWELPGVEAVLQIIRRQVRSELMLLPLATASSWVVPHSAAETTQAHVGALLLIRRGQMARPWLWSGVPERGPFLIVGAQAAGHPAATDGLCRGVYAFHHLLRDAGMFTESPLSAVAPGYERKHSCSTGR